MSTNKTTNYNLHLWEPSDDFVRVEFNENNAIIDAALGALASRASNLESGKADESSVASRIAALQTSVNSLSSGKADESSVASRVAALNTAIAAKAQIAIGTYTGTGATEHTITVGFMPAFMVITQTDTGNGGSESYYLCIIGDRAKCETTVGPYYSGDTMMFESQRTATGIILRHNPNWDATVAIMNVSGKHYSYFAIG